MFRFPKPLDVITLFHKPSLPASQRVLNILKQASATASQTTTEDQASDNTLQARRSRGEFQLDVTELPPTPDQLRNILDYASATGERKTEPGEVMRGAGSVADALRLLKEEGGGERFVRPVVVDWSNGKAVVGDNESEILKMLRQASD
ncbi:thioredoxin-like protein [Thermoascus aurantiacus ATCC 26904]